MNLLVPCAGRSSRFHTQAPKYLLSMPDGKLMFELAIAPYVESADRICFAILREHDEQFGAAKILCDLVPNAEVFVLDEVTRGQAETASLMVSHFGISGAFLLKDSDSFFVPSTEFSSDHNYISVCSAREVSDVKLFNKSFAVINEQGYIVGTVEKEITSEFFSCGGYFFSDADEFQQSFQRFKSLQVGSEMYVSQVIDLMIHQGHVFHPMHCLDYQDWGTHEEWISMRQRVSTYFIDLDGVLYESGSRYWSPRWGESAVFPQVRDQVNALYEAGNYILLASNRPESFRQVTEQQLAQDEVKYHQLVLGIHHGRRVVVNDFGPTNPYPSAVAINTKRNAADFADRVSTPFAMPQQ